MAGTAPLEQFLRYYQSGYGDQAMSKEMYDAFGGEDVAKSLEQWNPGAKWVDAEMGGGEGGSQGMGKKLVFADGQIHTPTSKSGIDLLNMRAAKGSGDLYNPNLVYHDENFGDITHSSNIDRRPKTFIDKYGPAIAAAAISMVAPMAAPAMFGAMSAGALGAGALGAGFTSGVTGGAAGLGAGSVPGALGAGTFTAANAPGWAASAAKQAPSLTKTLGGMGTSGDWDITKFLPMIASAFGVDPNMITAGKTGLTLAQMARAYQKQHGQGSE